MLMVTYLMNLSLEILPDVPSVVVQLGTIDFLLTLIVVIETCQKIYNIFYQVF